METSGLSNEVLRLLLAQNSLQITGLREQLIERLGSISPSNPSSVKHSRNADASASAAKCLRPNRQEPSGNDVHEPRVPTPEVGLPDNTTAEQNDNNQDVAQDGDHNDAPTVNPALNPTHLATLIGNIVDQKLKNFMPPLQSASSLPTTPLVSASTSQASKTQQLADPTFLASLLSQPPTSASPELPLPSSTPSSSLAHHVSTNTKQAILRGEYVEFDLLLPENSSLLTDNELTGCPYPLAGNR